MRLPYPSRLHGSPLRSLILLFALACALGLGCTGDDGDDGDSGAAGPPGPIGPPGPPGDPSDPSTAVEGCLGCHAANAVVPVDDITDLGDAHYVDTDPFGPLTAAGYRQLDVVLSTVDVTGSSIVMNFDIFDVTSAGSAPVDDILASDGRFTLARLVAGAPASGDPSAWERIVNGERFTTTGGLFENLGVGAYRYTSVFDLYVDWSRHDLLLEEGSIDCADESKEIYEVLRKLGYSVGGGEQSNTWSWAGWRAQFDEILGRFFPLSGTD